jgi:hypothetical protein
MGKPPNQRPKPNKSSEGRPGFQAKAGQAPKSKTK